MFPDAVDTWESETGTSFDELYTDHEVFVRDDTKLVIGNALDGIYYVWDEETWKFDAKSIEEWREGAADGDAALRTNDRGWRDE